MDSTVSSPPRVDYRTDPTQYKHWNLSAEGALARLTLDVAEDAGIRPGYKLKLNSYDLGVDVELADALNRIRFEHPEVRSVIVTSGKDRVFCSGANIFMLGVSSHAWKVNFCKFTNETRNGIEDTSQHSGIKFVAAVNGACAGGGYELALACDEIILVDDRSSSVSLPEVPLLGVLPGTGGLTRVTDKRKVRHDLADIFCTSVEGVRGQRAVEWRLVDAVAKPAQFAAAVHERAEKLAATSPRPASARGVALSRLERDESADAIRYQHVTVEMDRARRTATITIQAPAGAQPTDIAAIEAAGAVVVAARDGAPARRRDPAPAHQRARARHLDPEDRGRPCGRARRRPDDARAARPLVRARNDRHAAPHLRAPRRLVALAVRADRAGLVLRRPPGRARVRRRPRLHARAARRRRTRAEAAARRIQLRPAADGERSLAPRAPLPRRGGAARRGARHDRRKARSTPTPRFRSASSPLRPDDIDWDDEVRIAIEERAAMSPDALTGLEANLRFGPGETMATRVFGRLTAWQNWIFQRPNAVGEKGALKVYGTGEKAGFDFKRV